MTWQCVWSVHRHCGAHSARRPASWRSTWSVDGTVPPPPPPAPSLAPWTEDKGAGGGLVQPQPGSHMADDGILDTGHRFVGEDDVGEVEVPFGGGHDADRLESGRYW